MTTGLMGVLARKKDSVIETQGQDNVTVPTDRHGGKDKGGLHSKNTE